jgi:hypothetical protein
MQALLDTREGMDPQDPNFPAISAEIDAQIEAQIRKVSGIHAFRAHALAMAARCDLMQSTYLAARISWESTVDRLEEYVKSTMEHAGKKELEGDGLKIKLRANPPSVILIDETLIPSSFKKIVTPEPFEKIDKTLIAKALKAGLDVPGADLNISSTRVDWGDPAKPKKAAMPADSLQELMVAKMFDHEMRDRSANGDLLPQVKGETE